MSVGLTSVVFGVTVMHAVKEARDQGISLARAALVHAHCPPT